MKTINIVAVMLASLGLAACDTEEHDPEPVEDAPQLQTQAQSEPVAMESALDEILAGSHRSDENRARDRYRNPLETLAFFQVEPTHTVIEMNPGGGWYMEILGPLLNEQGQYIAATPDPEADDVPEYVVDHAHQIEARIDDHPELYGNGEVRYFDPENPVLGEPGSADRVLTFRSVHGWIHNDQAEAMFAAFAEVLKAGGILGVVQHRAAEGEDPANGYVPESTIVELAASAGLILDERTDINANPSDTRDHPEGVWTLPPSLALGDKNREEYLAIGESDRMTLRFVKPVP